MKFDSAEIKDKDSKVVAKASSLTNGMSSVSYIPLKNQEQKIYITKGKSKRSYDLPPIHPSHTMSAYMLSEPSGVFSYFDSEMDFEI